MRRRKLKNTLSTVILGFALLVTALFLIGYISYHYAAPIFVFRGHGWIRR